MDYCLNFREARDMDPVTRNVVVAWVQRNRTVFPVAPKSFDEKVLAFVDALLARIDALTAQRMEPTCACGHEEERVMEQEWCCTQHLVKAALLTALDRVLALHVADEKNLCDECFQDWPCETVQALDAV
jgi:hypothetical protein